MESEKLILLIIGMALVTYIPRVAPALFFSRKKMSDALNTWLHYVPSSIIGALLISSLLVNNGSLDLSASNIALLSAIPTLVVACITRSLVITVIAGVAAASVIKAFI